MHDDDFDHEHALTDEQIAEQSEALAQFIWSQDNIELRTIGIDIGSSTSHLLFAKVALQRQSLGLSSRFIVISREVVWRSPIMLTPFLPDGTIDAAALGDFIRNAYTEAGFAKADVDSGAVILTGEAIKRKNARAIDELFATEAGKFVCATAGHKLECTLAAHGSGAVTLSKQRDARVLHVDIGGGTTKLALIDRGKLVSVSAFAVGGRLLARDAKGAWTRVDDSAQRVAKALGLATTPNRLADRKTREAIAGRLASIAVDQILGTPLDTLGQDLQLTEPLDRSIVPELITFSGGVAEYIFGHETKGHGDIAQLLAEGIVTQLGQRAKIPAVDPGQRIRATVIGASQFTVQVSGKTIYLSDENVLPVHNVPVLHIGSDFSGDIVPADVTKAVNDRLALVDLAPASRMAIAFDWQGDPEYARLRATAEGIAAAVTPGRGASDVLFLMIDGDIGRSIGRLLEKELKLPGAIVSVDGVQLKDFDYVDVGTMISPPGVVPMVIKSLLFS
jgi:ethanolamine utilization protein EutA